MKGLFRDPGKKRLKNHRSKSAVSEIVGTILILAITVLLVGGVAIWATQIPPPAQEALVDLSGSLDYEEDVNPANGVDTYYITHEGGQVLDKEDIEIHIKYAPAAALDSFSHILSSPYKIDEGDEVITPGVGTNGFWEVGETFSVRTAPMAKTALYSLTGQVLIQVVFITETGPTIIMESKFQQGTDQSSMSDISIAQVNLDSPNYIIDQEPIIEVVLENLGANLAIDPADSDISVRIFDNDVYLGTATYVSGDAIVDGGNNDLQFTPGETWRYVLDTQDNLHSSWTSSQDWRDSNNWQHTGLHSLNVKVIPLDAGEGQYTNNYFTTDVSVQLNNDWQVQGPDPAVDTGWVKVSNTNPRNGEVVSITVIVKNRGDAAIPVPADETESVWLAISTEPITRVMGTELWDWTPDSDDDDLEFSAAEPTCVVKDLTISPSGQEEYTFNWIANAAYPGERVSVYFAVDVDHTIAANPGTVDQTISHFSDLSYPMQGDDPSNNQAIIEFQVMPKVLVVDGDAVEKGNVNDVTGSVVEGLIGSGVNVDGYIRATPSSPKYDDQGLEPFDIIIWVAGRNTHPLSNDNVDAITAALDDGKYVWLIGNHIMEHLDGAAVTSPTLLSGGGGTINNVGTGTDEEQLLNTYLGVSRFYTGSNPNYPQELIVKEEPDTSDPPLTDWMDGMTEYTMDYKSSAATSNLVYPEAYWKFDEGVGTTAADDSPQSHDGILYEGGGVGNGPTWSMGYSGSSLYFDGVNDIIEVPDSGTINTMNVYTRSYSLWFKADDTTTRQVLYKEGGGSHGLSIYIYNGDLYCGAWSLNTPPTGITDVWLSTPFTDTSDWHHVGFCLDTTNGEQVMYLDGKVVDTDSQTGRIPSHGGDITIGASDNNHDFHDGSFNSMKFNGYLDEFRIYNSYVTEEGIEWLMDPVAQVPRDRTIETIHTQRAAGAGEEITRIIETDAIGATTRWNSIAVNKGAGNYKSVLSGFDFASLDRLNDKINITMTVMNWFDWEMDIGDDLAITDFWIEPENPKFMETVTISVVARNNGKYDHHNQIMFYVADERGVEKQMPAYMGDFNPLNVDITGGSQKTYSIRWLATETGKHTFRAKIDPYNILQEVSEANNDLSYSGVSTESLILQSILVVDDDGMPDTSAYLIEDSLDALGIENDLWDVSATGIPNVNDMKFYNTVIWCNGLARGSIDTAATQTEIRNYLEGNYVESSYLEDHNETLLYIGYNSLAPVAYGPGTFFHDVLGISAENFQWNTVNDYHIVGKDDSSASHGIDLETIGGGDYINSYTKAVLGGDDSVEDVYYRDDGSIGSGDDLCGVTHTNSIFKYKTMVFGQDPYFMVDTPTSGADKENAVTEWLYMNLHWLGIEDSRPDFRCTDMDISISDDNPQLGNAYVISANIQNIGDGDGSCSVRFMDGNTLVRTSTIFIAGGDSVVEECIWVPLFAGSGSSNVRTITVELDKMDRETEIFESFNNRPSVTTPVYFLFDDMNYVDADEANGAWYHESTVLKINGESTLEYMDNAKTDIVGSFNQDTLDDANNKWIQNMNVDHSMPSSFSIKEPLSSGDINTQLDVILVIDKSGSMGGSRWTNLLLAHDVLVDSMDGNDRIAEFVFDSGTYCLTDFITCDTAGKTQLKNAIRTRSPGGGTYMYRCIVRDANGDSDWDGTAGDTTQDDGAIWYMTEYRRPTAIPNLICLSDGDSWDTADYDNARDAIWTAAGRPTVIDNWYPTGANPGRTANPNIPDMGLFCYSIGVNLPRHDPNGGANPIQERPRDLSPGSDWGSYDSERKMWNIAQESMTGGGWSDNGNGVYDPGEYAGYGYYYTTDPTELSTIFEQISQAMGSGGSTRSEQQPVQETPETRVGTRAGELIWYEFDDGAGLTASDSSGNGNTGTLTNGPTWTGAGRKGGAIVLDGVNDYVDVPAVALSEFTVAAWVYPTASQLNGIWSRYAGTSPYGGMLAVRNDIATIDTLTYAGTSGSNQGDGTNIPLNTWSFVVFTYDGASGTSYVNGNPLPGSISGGALPATSAAHYIGCLMPGFWQYGGRIDDFRLYDRTLTQEEIRIIMGPEVHLKLDEGSGSTASDSSGYGNDGTTNNMNNADWITGRMGNALDFDGSNDYLSIPDTVPLRVGTNGKDFTVAFWFNLRQGATGSWRLFMHKGTTTNQRTFAAWMRPSDNRIHYRISTTSSWNEGGDSTSAIPLNQWVHIAYILEGGVLKLYIDGTLDHSTNLAGTAISNTGPISFGGSPIYTDTRCYMDDIRIYNYALTQSEIDALSPPPVDYPVPYDGSLSVDKQPTLLWYTDDTLNIDHYEIYFGTDPSPSLVTNPDNSLPYEFIGERYNPGLLLSDTDYYWQVKVVADSGAQFLGPIWTFRTEIINNEQVGGEDAHEGLNRLDTMSFSLTGSDSATMQFWHKFNIAGTINGAYLELGVYDGTGDQEDISNYDWYYIQPEETYNSNLYLGSATSINRPDLGPAGSNYQLSSPDDPTKVIWCWNGKSNNGLFEWEFVSVDLFKQADLITANSADTIDLTAQPLKLGFSYFYFGGGIGGGWWIDDIKVTSHCDTPVSGATDVWQWRDDGDGAPGSPGGYWWNGEPGAGNSRTNLLVGGIDNSLVTRPIDLTSATDVHFNAQFAYNVRSLEGLPPDGMRIELSDDGGLTWIPINYGVRTFDGTSGAGAAPTYEDADGNPRVNADLTAWAGKVVILRFRVVTTNALTHSPHRESNLAWGGIFIDDVIISGLSVSDSRSEGFSVSELQEAPAKVSSADFYSLFGSKFTVNDALNRMDAKVLEERENPAFVFVPMGISLLEVDLGELMEEPIELGSELREFTELVLLTKKETEFTKK